MSDRNVRRARAVLEMLENKIESGTIPQAVREWGGANVIISTKPLDTHYREVITPHALEMSWVFTQLRDAFSVMIGSCAKFEFYGRLAIAANTAVAAGRQSKSEVLRAVVESARGMLDELSARRFTYMSVAEGIEIYADRGRHD